MQKRNNKPLRKRIAYSQNFIRDKNLIAELLRKSKISKADTVYEIGAGQGIITDELVKASGKVIAFEIDTDLYRKLFLRFQNTKDLELKSGDFLNYPLPNFPYKVFSNIPFNITSAVLKKLTQTINPPDDAYLIVQKEAGVKFIGKPLDEKTSQVATLLKPWFDMSFIHKFNSNDFFPKPMVNIVLMRIEKRKEPLISYKAKKLYEDFVVYTYNQFKPNILEGLSSIFNRSYLLKLLNELGISPNSKPSELEQTQWNGLFHYFLSNVDINHQRIVNGSFDRQSKQQSSLEKIHRTRVDKDWKKY